MNVDSAVPAMNRLERAGEVLFKARDYTPVPIVLLGILFAAPTIISLVVGFSIALLGEFIRAYGVAFIGSISRTRSYSNGQLVTTGPFSVVRNPLYLGNLVLSLGLSVTTNLFWLPPVVLVLFYGQYVPIVAWEEMKLRRIFGSSYAEYCAKVPRRWFPAFGALMRIDWFERPGSWRPALRSEKRTLTAILAFVAAMLGLYFWNEAAGGGVLPLVGQFIGW